MTTVFKKRKNSSSCSSHDVKADESHQVDRISDLPDCVLSHILSRLPTKDAMRTCVLSRDWKNKWTSIYNVDITDESPFDTSEESDSSMDEGEALLGEDRAARFKRYVDKVVDSTHNLRIRSFSLALGDKFHDSRHLKTWMRKILNRGVKNLSIVAPRSKGSIVMPKRIGRHSFLTQLKLSLNFNLEIRSVNCFPKLKRLYLSGERTKFGIVNKQSNETGHLSLTFPVLKILELAHFRFLNVKSVVIDVPVLTRYKHYWAYGDCEIKIVAPKLVNFTVLHGDVENYVLCAPSLCSATLMHGWQSKILASQNTAFLKGVPSLKWLSISGEIVQAIFKRKGVNSLPSLNQLQLLQLHFASTKVLLELLHATPYLQFLTLFSIPGYNNHQTIQEPLPPCIMSQLKKVKFVNFRGSSHQISLANLFLEKANKLERMLVYLDDQMHNTRYKNDSLSWLAALGPESSSRVRIIEKLNPGGTSGTTADPMSI